MSEDLSDGLLSTGQIDKELHAATIQMGGKSIPFIPDEQQEQILQILFNEMNPDNVIAKAELNADGLHEVKISRDSSRTLAVSVFPRVGTNTLSQAVYILHASLRYMPKDSMITKRSTAYGNALAFSYYSDCD